MMYRQAFLLNRRYIDGVIMHVDNACVAYTTVIRSVGHYRLPVISSIRLCHFVYCLLSYELNVVKIVYSTFNSMLSGFLRGCETILSSLFCRLV